VMATLPLRHEDGSADRFERVLADKTRCPEGRGNKETQEC
jgi:hypothetical protein